MFLPILMSIFVYGSLMTKEIVHNLLSRVPTVVPNVSLHNYQRFSVQRETYPAIKSVEGAIVKGKILTGLNDIEMALLDQYEGTEYKRISVTVYNSANQPVQCFAYEWIAGDGNLTGDWDYQIYLSHQGYTDLE